MTYVRRGLEEFREKKLRTPELAIYIARSEINYIQAAFILGYYAVSISKHEEEGSTFSLRFPAVPSTLTA
jgi:hypothetical protein